MCNTSSAITSHNILTSVSTRSPNLVLCLGLAQKHTHMHSTAGRLTISRGFIDYTNSCAILLSTTKFRLAAMKGYSDTTFLAEENLKSSSLGDRCIGKEKERLGPTAAQNGAGMAAGISGDCLRCGKQRWPASFGSARRPSSMIITRHSGCMSQLCPDSLCCSAASPCSSVR